MTYGEFVKHINQSKRDRLIRLLKEPYMWSRRDMDAVEIRVMPCAGWSTSQTPRRDKGKQIIGYVKYDDGKVFFFADELKFTIYPGKKKYGVEEIREECYFREMPDTTRLFLSPDKEEKEEERGEEVQTESPYKTKTGKPFKGFNGGRKKRVLSDDEKAQIIDLRQKGLNVNQIAKEVKISNRVISEFVKMNKHK